MSKVVQLFPQVVCPSPPEDFNIDEQGGLSMHIDAFRDLVRETLKLVDLHSCAAENLLVGTALVESGLNCVKQHNNGPAKSFLQVEKTTYNDICRYLDLYRNKALKDRILASMYTDIMPPFEAIEWNIRLSIIAARIKYYMQPEKLPDACDAARLCLYHKTYYNSSMGKTDTKKSIIYFKLACSN